jgi:hypothetical protein
MAFICPDWGHLSYFGIKSQDRFRRSENNLSLNPKQDKNIHYNIKSNYC